MTITHVEVVRLGVTEDGRPFFVVDLVEADDARAGRWDGFDHGEAVGAAGDIAAGELPVVDRTRL